MIVQNIDLVAAPAVTIAAGLVAAVARQTIVNELTNHFAQEKRFMQRRLGAASVLLGVYRTAALDSIYGRPGFVIRCQPDPYWTRLWNAVRGR